MRYRLVKYIDIQGDMIWRIERRGWFFWSYVDLALTERSAREKWNKILQNKPTTKEVIAECNQ